MIDFVLDASALLELAAGPAPARDLVHRAATGRGAAPEMIDIEVLHTLRRLVRSGQVERDAADEITVALADAPIARSPHRALLARVWELRESVTAYDAAYVALAEQLAVPLLTCDARLGRAHGHRAEVVVYPRS